VRKVEASELIAADLFRSADQTRYRITFGDVEKYLAQLGHSTPAAAMRYQHAAAGRDQVIAEALSKIARGE
jgi:hypothetical protein